MEVSCVIQPRIWWKKQHYRWVHLPRCLFTFAQLSRLSSTWSPLLEHQWVCSTIPEDWTHYCIHIRATLEEGKSDQPPPSHAWTELLIANILQEACPKRSNHQSCGLSNNGWQSYSLEGPCSGRGSSIAMHMTFSSAWGAQLVGSGELHR